MPGFITIEFQCLFPEKVVNLLWKNNIYVKNVKKKNIATTYMTISLKDYLRVKKITQDSGIKIKITRRNGFAFFVSRLKTRIIFVFGFILFWGIIYYLSTYIFTIDIRTDGFVAPFEIREELNSYGIRAGIRRNSIDVYDIEKRLIKDNDNIMWVNVRVAGSTMNVSAIHRQAPPEIKNEENPCDMIAKRDGQIERIFASKGTAQVKQGDKVKAGQVLIKGIQGKEGTTSEVHAEGNVIAKTFYESSEEYPKTEVNKTRTGKKVSNIFLNVFGKKIYLKKNEKLFAKYDKIIVNRWIYNCETFYEIKEKSVPVNIKKITPKEENKLYETVLGGLSKSSKVVDKLFNCTDEGEKYLMKMVVVVEEDIGTY